LATPEAASRAPNIAPTAASDKASVAFTSGTKISTAPLPEMLYCVPE
jgi:hypothetical protein